MNNKLAQLVPRARPYNVGLWVPMINDHRRSQLYDNLLSNSVKHKTCADIGFGSGVMTLIALHYGAKHIYAYEPDPTTFDFGKEVICRMGYSDQVTFINDYYDARYDTDIAIHEMIWRSFWGEGLYDIYKLLKQSSTTLLPSSVKCEIITTTSKPQLYDTPQIDTGLSYLQKLNQVWDSILESSEYKCLNNDFSDKEILSLFNDTIGSYSYNLNTDDIPDIIKVPVKIDAPCMVTCRFSINNMPLTDGHWKADKIISVKESGYRMFNQRTSDGNWWFE